MEPSEYQKCEFSIDIQKKCFTYRRKTDGPHYHNAFELHYIKKGNITFFVKNQVYNIKEGDFLFINMHEIHYPTECINETEKYVITYKASFAESNPYYKAPNVFQLLEHKLNGYNLVSLSGNKQHIESILNDMHEAYHKHSNYSMIYLQAHLTLLLTSLAEYIDTWTISDINTNCENLKIKQIISYIDERINTELSLDEISHYLNMNKYHLCRFFKKNTGLSLFNYIIRRRIINSEKLIMLNKHSITDICFMTGFNSLTHFERTFRQFTGISPRNYKKGITKEALIP